MIRQLLLHKGDSPSELVSTVRQFVKEYPNGVVVTVEPFCLPRTKKQNGQFQVLVKRLSVQSGFPTDAVKMMVKDIAVGHGYPVERDEDGEPIMQHGSYVPLSTAKATIGQFKLLIESCYDLALKYDIVLDDVKG